MKTIYLYATLTKRNNNNHDVFCLLAAGYGPQQTFELAASAAPMAASSSPSWHGASPIYASSCARHYDDWPPNAAVNSAAIAGPAHSPNSPGGQYHKWQIIIKNCAYCCSIGLFMFHLRSPLYPNGQLVLCASTIFARLCCYF